MTDVSSTESPGWTAPLPPPHLCHSNIRNDFICLADDHLSSSVALTQADRQWLMAASGFHRSRKMVRAMRSVCQQLDAENRAISYLPQPSQPAVLAQGPELELKTDIDEICDTWTTPTTPIKARSHPLGQRSLPPLDVPKKCMDDVAVLSPSGVFDLNLDDAPSIHALPSSFIGRSCRLRRATKLLAIALETRPPASLLVEHGILNKSPTALLRGRMDREDRDTPDDGNQQHAQDDQGGGATAFSRVLESATSSFGSSAVKRDTYARARRSWSPVRRQRRPSDESPTGATLEAMEKGLLLPGPCSPTPCAARVYPI